MEGFSRWKLNKKIYFRVVKDVWSCRRLEKDGVSVKEQGQVKVSAGEKVYYQEELCSFGERVCFEGAGFQVVEEALEDSKDS